MTDVLPLPRPGEVLFATKAPATRGGGPRHGDGSGVAGHDVRGFGDGWASSGLSHHSSSSRGQFLDEPLRSNGSRCDPTGWIHAGFAGVECFRGRAWLTCPPVPRRPRVAG